MASARWTTYGGVVMGWLAVAATGCANAPSPAAPSAAVAVEGAALRDAKPEWAAAARPGPQSIVAMVVADDGEFDVLQAAVVRAGLAGVLGGPGQFTVFAPTDAAFVSSLGVADEAAAIAAVNGLDVDVLRDILLFHVTEGRRTSRSVLAAPRYAMLNGDVLTRTALSAAGLAATDLSASNGVIHVIAAVLMPPA